MGVCIGKGAYYPQAPTHRSKKPLRKIPAQQMLPAQNDNCYVTAVDREGRPDHRLLCRTEQSLWPKLATHGW